MMQLDGTNEKNQIYNKGDTSEKGWIQNNAWDLENMGVQPCCWKHRQVQKLDETSFIEEGNKYLSATFNTSSHTGE
jgi:hypothetical protein